VCLERKIHGQVIAEPAKKSNVGHYIIDKSTEFNIDMIIMGSRGLSHIKSLVLGSVSRYVMNHAACDVFIVRDCIIK